MFAFEILVPLVQDLWARLTVARRGFPACLTAKFVQLAQAIVPCEERALWGKMPTMMLENF